MLTLNQAKTHLAAIKKLAVEENQFLSCVHHYLRNVEIDVTHLIRADQFSGHDQIADLIKECSEVEQCVNKFFLGSL